MRVLMSLLFLAVPPLQSELPHAFPRDGATKVFENDRIIVWEFVLEPGESTPVFGSYVPGLT